MQNPFRFINPWIVVAAGLCLAHPAAASPAAQQFVRERQAELVELVRKGADAEVHRVFAETLDYPTIAKDSLGDAWAGLTPKQREEFRCVLQQLVARAYQRDLRRTLDYGVSFEGVKEVEKGILVATVAKSKKNVREEALRIDYLVHQVGGTFRVRDIVTEGSSMVGNYQMQFRKLLKRKGFEEMLRTMKEKAGAGAASCG